MFAATGCAQNQHVVSNACVDCVDTTNAAGDDPTGGDTACGRCGTNERVFNNGCLACPSGMDNAAGDLVAGAETQCSGESWLARGPHRGGCGRVTPRRRLALLSSLRAAIVCTAPSDTTGFVITTGNKDLSAGPLEETAACAEGYGHSAVIVPCVQSGDYQLSGCTGERLGAGWGL